MNRLDLSPSIDTTIDLLQSDSEILLSRELYRELRSRGYNPAESLAIVYRHFEYPVSARPQDMSTSSVSSRFVRRQ